MGSDKKETTKLELSFPWGKYDKITTFIVRCEGDVGLLLQHELFFAFSAGGLWLNLACPMSLRMPQSAVPMTQFLSSADQCHPGCDPLVYWNWKALDAISSFPLALTKNSWVEAHAKLERGIATVQKCCTLGERWRKICVPVFFPCFQSSSTSPSGNTYWKVWLT